MENVVSMIDGLWYVTGMCTPDGIAKIMTLNIDNLYCHDHGVDCGSFLCHRASSQGYPPDSNSELPSSCC